MLINISPIHLGKIIEINHVHSERRQAANIHDMRESTPVRLPKSRDFGFG